MARLPKFYRDLVAHVRKHGDKIGDGHAGWAAITDHWETFDIARTLVLNHAKTPIEAIGVMSKVADEILTNSAVR